MKFRSALDSVILRLPVIGGFIATLVIKALVDIAFNREKEETSFTISAPNSVKIGEKFIVTGRLRVGKPSLKEKLEALFKAHSHKLCLYRD